MEQVQGHLTDPDLTFLTTHPAGIESRNRKGKKKKPWISENYATKHIHKSMGLFYAGPGNT